MALQISLLAIFLRATSVRSPRLEGGGVDRVSSDRDGSGNRIAAGGDDETLLEPALEKRLPVAFFPE